jgi:hypothetical protein
LQKNPNYAGPLAGHPLPTQPATSSPPAAPHDHHLLLNLQSSSIQFTNNTDHKKKLENKRGPNRKEMKQVFKPVLT